MECRIGSLHLCFERSPSGSRCCRNPRAQLVPLLRPMLTQMYVGGAMAGTHDYAPLSKRIPPVFASAAHKCTLNHPQRAIPALAAATAAEAQVQPELARR